jgi:tetratricopeptide (TPR) repeat protein/transcriptional regulator with XRE-family HTH domain
VERVIRDADQGGPNFGGLLRRLRVDAGLTQEELAEAATVGARSVSDLERGVSRTARPQTARLLATALGLAGPERDRFLAAARGPFLSDGAHQPMASVAGVGAAAAIQALPRDIAGFTGRADEVDWMMTRLAGTAARGGRAVGICAIGGMAGIGKTTLAVHAAHLLAPAYPDGQFFLPLHGHTPGHRPTDPAEALASLLLAAGLPATQIPPGLEPRAARWRDFLAGKKILLVLDDASGHEQVEPLLPGTPGSTVLITSRRRLAALDDAAVISLDVLAPGEAAALLVRLADRPEMTPADAGVAEIAKLCGYLPLALGILARQLRHHPAWTAADRAAELAAERDRLALINTESVSVAAAFSLSYRDLTTAQRRMFRRLGLVPGPTFDAYAAAALDGATPDTARRHLEELYDQHLVAEPAPGRYQLHDLLRAHARALVAADSLQRSGAATGRLLDYYLHTAAAAGRYFGYPGRRRPPPGNPPAQTPELSTPGQAGAWLEAERANLQAAADHAAAHTRFLHAIAIPAAMTGFLAARGYWDQSSALHQTGLTVARRTGDRLGEADTLTALGALQAETGDYPAASDCVDRALVLYGELGNLPGQAHALIQLGFVHALTGDYQAAAASHEKALALARSAGDHPAEAEALLHLGLLQQLTGDYPAAATSNQEALALFRDLGEPHGQAYALNTLGVVQQETGDYPAATASQQQALALFSDLGAVLGQARALNDLGLVQQETGHYRSAEASHQQALTLFRDNGNQLGQAEALNRIGELSARTSAAGQARERHTHALAIARDINAAPEEARALEGLGRARLLEGSPGEGAAHLRHALAIYQRIASPAARRVQDTLRQNGL